MSTLPVSLGFEERFAAFMRKVASETYPEPVCEMHTDLTRQAMEFVLSKIPENPESVLDVGCGQGPALSLFKRHGIDARGIALNMEDVQVCLANGFIAMQMDQNDLQFLDGSFNLIWARHVIEHSIAPLWTLTEFWRVLKPGGWVYVEVPGPDTECYHESNKNHYSVLGRRAWPFLFEKTGFRVKEGWQTSFGTLAGPDVYFSFLLQKP